MSDPERCVIVQRTNREYAIALAGYGILQGHDMGLGFNFPPGLSPKEQEKAWEVINHVFCTTIRERRHEIEKRDAARAARMRLAIEAARRPVPEPFTLV